MEELSQEDITKVAAKSKKTNRRKAAAKSGPENGFELIERNHPSRCQEDLLREDDSEEIELENQKSATQVPARDFQVPKKKRSKEKGETRNSGQFLSDKHKLKIKSKSVEHCKT